MGTKPDLHLWLYHSHTVQKKGAWSLFYFSSWSVRFSLHNNLLIIPLLRKLSHIRTQWLMTQHLLSKKCSSITGTIHLQEKDRKRESCYFFLQWLWEVFKLSSCNGLARAGWWGSWAWWVCTWPIYTALYWWASLSYLWNGGPGGPVSRSTPLGCKIWPHTAFSSSLPVSQVFI